MYMRDIPRSFTKLIPLILTSGFVTFLAQYPAAALTPCGQDPDSVCKNSPMPKTCHHAMTIGCERLQELVGQAETEEVERESELPYVPGNSPGGVIQHQIDVSMQLLPKMINPFGSECARPEIVGVCFKRQLPFIPACIIPAGLVVEYRKPISIVTPSRVAYQSQLLTDIDGQLHRQLFKSLMYTQPGLETLYLSAKLYQQTLQSALGISSSQNNLLPPAVGGLEPPSLDSFGDNSLPPIPNILSNGSQLTEGEKAGIRIARESTLNNDDLLFQNLTTQHDAPIWSHVVPTIWRFVKVWPWDCSVVKATPADRWNSAFPENWSLLFPETTLSLGGRYGTYLQDLMQDPRSCQRPGLGDEGEFGDNTPSDALEPFGVTGYDGDYPPHCIESRTGAKVPLSPFFTSSSSSHHGQRYFVGGYKGLAGSCQMRPDLWYGVNAINDADTKELVDKIEVAKSLTHHADDISENECSDFDKFASDLGKFNEEGNPIQPAGLIHWKRFRVCVGLTDFIGGIGDMASIGSELTGIFQQISAGGSISSSFSGGMGSGGGCMKACKAVLFNGQDAKLVYGEGCE